MPKVTLRFLFCVCAMFSLNATGQETNRPQTHVLFVCTGNFYRSRFAAALFNEKAGEAHLNWQADSRGLKLDSYQHGISPFAKRELVKRGVSPRFFKGNPKALTREDLQKNDYIVLMDEAEHRPMLEKLFPGYDGQKIHYWHIEDIGQMKAAKACEAMARQIEELIRKAEK